MSILQTSMSHISDPPKIDYTDARTQDTYYHAHQGYELNLKARLRLVRRIVSRFFKFQREPSPRPVLTSKQAPL